MAGPRNAGIVIFVGTGVAVVEKCKGAGVGVTIRGARVGVTIGERIAVRLGGTAWLLSPEGSGGVQGSQTGG